MARLSRGRGGALVLWAALVDRAPAAGARSVVLNSGSRQPEALALYAALGYTSAPGYGVYAGLPGAVFLGKRLTGEEER